ncbi:type II secretion system protein (plasmid) [Kitasatospora sp. NBC_00374]|uniref:type II secretion system F family protein n=1 Tax=Kitasatospora sp. NBC_00374 TaxID=2975964 RepID=UPI0030E15B40
MYLLIRALVPSRPGSVATVARIDALRITSSGPAPAPTVLNGAQDRALAALGPKVAAFYAKQGWRLARLRPDLALVEKPMETFLAQKVLYSAAGLLLGPLLAVVLWLVGVTSSMLAPMWLTLLLVAGCFFAPDLEVRSQAKEKRREFTRMVSVYLTLVHLSLSAGAGLPEAMKATAESSDAWPMRRIRWALEEARVKNLPYWTAPGRLGEEIGVPELVEFTSTVRLVAQDGAKVRTSLESRAQTLRNRELAEMQGAAAAKSQSMLVAQLLLCFGFLIFLIYPALTLINL